MFGGQSGCSWQSGFFQHTGDPASNPDRSLEKYIRLNVKSEQKETGNRPLKPSSKCLVWSREQSSSKLF